MLKLGQAVVRFQCIGVDRATGLNVLANLSLKRFLLAVGHDSGAYLTGLSVLAALKNSHHRGFILAARTGDFCRTLALVHVPRLPADEGFFGLNVAGCFLGWLQSN